MTRHHLLHVYTGIRTEIERLASNVRPGAAGASDAFGLSAGTGIITDLSKLLCDPDGTESELDSDVHQ